MKCLDGTVGSVLQVEEGAEGAARCRCVLGRYMSADNGDVLVECLGGAVRSFLQRGGGMRIY